MLIGSKRLSDHHCDGLLKGNYILSRSGMAMPLVAGIIFALFVAGAGFFMLVSQRRHETVLSHNIHQADLLLEAAVNMTVLKLRKAFESFDEDARLADTPLNRLYYQLLAPRHTDNDGNMDISDVMPIALSGEDLDLNPLLDSIPGPAPEISVSAELIRARAIVDNSHPLPGINSPPPAVSDELLEFFNSGKLPVLDMHLPTISLSSLLTFNVPGVGAVKLGHMLGLHRFNLSEEIVARVMGTTRDDIFPLKLGLSYSPPLPSVAEYGWPSWGPSLPDMHSVSEDTHIEKVGILQLTASVKIKTADSAGHIQRQMITEKEFRMPDRHAPAPMYSFFIDNFEDREINLNKGGNLYINSWPHGALLDNISSFLAGELKRDCELPGSIRYNGTQPTVVFPSLFAYRYEYNTPIVGFGLDNLRGCELLISMHPKWLPSVGAFIPKGYGLTHVHNFFSLIKGVIAGLIPVFQGGEFNPNALWIHSTADTWLMFWLPYVRPRTMGDIIYEYFEGKGWLLETAASTVSGFLDGIQRYSKLEGEEEWKYTVYGIPTLGFNEATTHLFGNYGISPPLNRACEGLVEKRTFTYYNALGYLTTPFFPIFLSFSALEQGKFTYPSFQSAPHWSGSGEWQKMFLVANHAEPVMHNPAETENRPRYLYHHTQYKLKSAEHLNSQAELDEWLLRNQDAQGAVVFDRWIYASDESGGIVLNGFNYRGYGGIYSDVNIIVKDDIKAVNSGADRLSLISWHETTGALIADTMNDVEIHAAVAARNGILNETKNLVIKGNLLVDHLIKEDPDTGDVKMGGSVTVNYSSPITRASVFSIQRIEGKYDPARYGLNFAPTPRSVSYQLL